MHSYTRDLIAFVKARPGEWIDAIRFEQFGRMAWRSRISDARQLLEATGEGTIENRQRRVKADKRLSSPRNPWFVVSEYRFVPAVREPQQLTLHEAQG